MKIEQKKYVEKQNKQEKLKEFSRNFLLSIFSLILIFSLIEIYFYLNEIGSIDPNNIDLLLKNDPLCSLDAKYGLDKNPAKELFNEGKEYFEKKDLYNSLVKFSESINADPNVSQAYLEKSKIEFILGEYNSSVYSALQALQICPNEYKAYMLLGDNYLAGNQIENAAKYYTASDKLKKNAVLFPLCGYREDKIIGFSLRENIQIRHFLNSNIYDIQTNSIGIRQDNEIKKEVDLDTKRVLFLGDSYIFGFGVDKSNTIPFLLENSLNSYQSKIQFEVLNLGVPAYNIEKESLFFDRFKDYDFDIVLIGLNGTDIFENKENANNECIGVTNNGCLFNYKECNSKKKQIFEQAFWWSKIYNLLKKNLIENIEQTNFWETNKKDLKLLVEKIRKKNAIPVIVYIPFIEILENKESSDLKLKKLSEFSIENNVLLIDPSDELIQNSKPISYYVGDIFSISYNEDINEKKQLYFFKFDDHTNANGNKVISQKIAIELKKNQ